MQLLPVYVINKSSTCSLRVTKLKFQQPVLLELPKFKTALEYRDTFAFGYEKIDSILDLHVDDIIGLFGESRYTNALSTRLVVRSLLSHKHGGVGAENVMIIDADNSVSPYLYVTIGRQYGMHHSKVLRNVIVTRQFTIYQLTNTILYDLPKRIQLHKPKVIVISGLLDQFLQDPHLHPAEIESLVSQIVKSLHKMKGVLFVLTSRFDDNDRVSFVVQNYRSSCQKGIQCYETESVHSK